MMVFLCSLYKRQQGGGYKMTTSSEAKRLMLALFPIAMSMDLELLPLKGRHRAPKYHSGPHIKLTYDTTLQHLQGVGNSLKGSC